MQSRERKKTLRAPALSVLLVMNDPQFVLRWFGRGAWHSGGLETGCDLKEVYLNETASGRGGRESVTFPAKATITNSDTVKMSPSGRLLHIVNGDKLDT